MNNDDFLDQLSFTLLDRVQDTSATREQRYDATQALLNRWRQGVDLDTLINLLHSDSSDSRLLGAYFLGELGHGTTGLNAAVIKLADDTVADCRRAFVEYIASVGSYDQIISEALEPDLKLVDRPNSI